jgi:diadenosine tetraphosphatase ApaH/serine/threonine PP2A family protein phosphatase
MNKYYGFYYEFLEKFKDADKFKEIVSLYDVLPICAIINGSILCLHGGIPENFEILNQIKGLKNIDLMEKNIDDSTLKSIESSIYQILWNDPKESLQGFMENYRGPGIKFYGEGVFNEFMQVNNLKYLVRAHEAFLEGYRWFFNERLLSIFSSADYRGEYFPNPASFAIIKNNRLFPKMLE